MKIKIDKIKPCVVGLGYVGLPVFLKISKFYKTVGFDINRKRIDYLNKKIDYNKEFNKENLKLKNKSTFTWDKKKLKECNFFIITVPTPIFPNKKPDLTYVKNACKIISKFLKKNDLVILESTVFPGTTEEICVPILSRGKKLTFKKDFNVGYSSERVNPGDKKHTIDKINKVLAFNAQNNFEKKRVLKIYKIVSKKIIFSKKIKEAEMSKLLENTQRDLNIAFINETKMLSSKLNLDFEEIYKLAASKWNFLKFKPGLVGGHCLPVDPYYLSYFGEKNKFKTEVTLSGRKINNRMKNFYFNIINKEILKSNISSGDKVCIAGVSYKENTADLRNSFAFEIYKKLRNKYKFIIGYDPLVFKSEKVIKYKIQSKLKDLNKIKLIIILVKHKIFFRLKKIALKNKIKIIEQI